MSTASLFGAPSTPLDIEGAHRRFKQALVVESMCVATHVHHCPLCGLNPLCDSVDCSLFPELGEFRGSPYGGNALCEKRESTTVVNVDRPIAASVADYNVDRITVAPQANGRGGIYALTGRCCARCSAPKARMINPLFKVGKVPYSTFAREVPLCSFCEQILIDTARAIVAAP